MNPRQRIGDIVARPLRFYFGLRAAPQRARVAELLDLVGLDPTLATRRPGELSGGQKQRVCIARALAARPDLVICDEITAALDPLVAEEILELLRRLQTELGTAYLFITHDLANVRRIADAILAMLGGSIVARGSTAEVLDHAIHPYLVKLIRSRPELRVGWLEDVLRAQSHPPP